MLAFGAALLAGSAHYGSATEVQAVAMSNGLHPELHCQTGGWLGIVSSSNTDEPENMYTCFSRLQAIVLNLRLVTFVKGWGCYSTTPVASHDASDLGFHLNSNKSDAVACEFHKRSFLHEITMGRDIYACANGGVMCKEGETRCCIPQKFQDCARRSHNEITECYAKLPPPLHTADSYLTFRTLGVLPCAVQHFRFKAVIELFTGKGTFLQNFASSVIANGGKLFTIDMVRTFLDQAVDATGFGTVIDVHQRRSGPFLRMPGSPKALPARRVLAKLPPGLYLFPTKALPDLNKTAASSNGATEPDNLLAAICNSLPVSTPTLVVLDAGIPLWREWVTIMKTCLDVLGVALFNTNHPGKVGYIRQELLYESHSWAEVLKWQEIVTNEVGAFVSELDKQVLLRRTASFLMHRHWCTIEQLGFLK